MNSRHQDECQEGGSRRRTARSSSGTPNPVDIHVGNRLRTRRILLGFSQQKVAGELGLTFQQVQKYERGANRIGASRLWDLSSVLDCPIGFFFEEMDERTAGAGPRNWDGEGHDNRLRNPDPINRRQSLELMRAYYRIDNANVRLRVYELTKSLGSVDETAEEILNTETSLQAGANAAMPDGGRA